MLSMRLGPQAVHNLPRCVSVCVRPRCPVPPRAVPAVHHMSLSPSRLVCPWWAPAPVAQTAHLAAGDTPHLMQVEQGLPWHPVATGLAGQAIPFIVAASHAHALPSPPFWFPCLVAPPPCLLCPPLSLLVWLPRSVCLCCSSPCLLALLGAPFAHPLLSHPPAPPPPPPPYADFTSPDDLDCPARGWLVTALLPPP